VWSVHPKTGGKIGEVRWYAPGVSMRSIRCRKRFMRDNACVTLPIFANSEPPNIGPDEFFAPILRIKAADRGGGADAVERR